MPRKPPQPADRIGKLETLGPNGEVPASKVPTASLAWDIANQLRINDSTRSEKRMRIYRAYKRFSPTSYSTIIERGAPWQSNVNWGQLKFLVDSQKSALYDMISEAPELVEIKTKFGGNENKEEYSEKLSAAFDAVLRNWPNFLVNGEQDIEEVLLYSKGIEIWTSAEGWQSYNVSNNDFLVPDEARFDFRNVETIAVKWDYSPNELYEAAVKNRDIAEKQGWNPDAVIDALRFNVTRNYTYQTREEWLKRVAEGSVNLTTFVNEKISTYWVYVREFDGTLTKLIVLQYYDSVVSGLRSTYTIDGKVTDRQIRDKIGFIFAKQKHMKGWEELFCAVTDSVGSGKWHEIQSQAEQAFVACREYDMTFNRIMDAVKINSMCMITGNNPDANKRLREMDFFPFQVLPDNVNIAQERISLPTQESLQTLTYAMRDLYSGMSVYKPNQATNGGRQRTRGEAELDEANQSQIQGTQLSRFNQGRTLYFRQLYKKFINTKKSEKGGELVELFYDLLEEWGVPKEAADWENIRSIKSKMLSGAGSKAMKLMAADRIINYTGMTPANPGQEKAIRMGIAAASDVGNVDVFRPTRPKVYKDSAYIIANENTAMSVLGANPQNFQVRPDDPHLEHIAGHYSDMMNDAQLLMQGVQNQVNPHELQDIIGRLQLKGGHSYAHINYVAQDQTKKKDLEAIVQNYEKLQQVIDQLAPQVQKMLEAEQQKDGESDITQDPRLQLEIAKQQIRLQGDKQSQDIKLAGKAAMHEVQKEIKQDSAANSIAIQRAKADSQIQIDRTKEVFETKNDLHNESES